VGQYGKDDKPELPAQRAAVAMNYDAMSNLSQATEVTCLSYDQSGDCLTSGPAPMASERIILPGN